MEVGPISRVAAQPARLSWMHERQQAKFPSAYGERLQLPIGSAGLSVRGKGRFASVVLREPFQWLIPKRDYYFRTRIFKLTFDSRTATRVGPLLFIGKARPIITGQAERVMGRLIFLPFQCRFLFFVHATIWNQIAKPGVVTRQLEGLKDAFVERPA